MENTNKDVGVEFEIKIQKLGTGGIIIIAPDVSAEVVRAVLSQALINITDEIVMNKAFLTLLEYMSNKEKQVDIFRKVKGVN